MNENKKSSCGGALKELLLITFGVVIAIGLTFGLASCLKHRQKAENRRQTVLMVISDIDNFKRELQYFDSSYFSVWKKDIEELQTLSADNIRKLTDGEREKYWDALLTPLALTRSNMMESILSNNIGIWLSINDFRFMETVGDCYSYIASIEKNVKIKMDEKGAIDRNFDLEYGPKGLSDGERLVTIIGLKEVKRYMDDLCNGFIPYIRESVEELQQYVNGCLELMSLKEEDLDAFAASGKL
ncbi:MAG: hypothetical protein IK031_02640 [Bacteroidales bacterium]|nr:hypothetical protein [Bacteroidales bacterium]